MASDSQVTLAGFDLTYPAKKIFRGRACIIGAAGDGENCSLLMEWAKNGFKASSRPKFRRKQGSKDDTDAVALVLQKDGIYILTDGDSELEKIEADYFAIGSGGEAARVAMMLGEDPEKAVELACQVDMNSGPPIQVLRLKDDSDNNGKE